MPGEHHEHTGGLHHVMRLAWVVGILKVDRGLHAEVFTVLVIEFRPLNHRCQRPCLVYQQGTCSFLRSLSESRSGHTS